MFEFEQKCPLPSEKLLRLALSLTVAMLSGIVSANPRNITDAEMQLLPRYCPYTATFKHGGNSSGAKRWRSLMGESFSAMHHYCWALNTMSRAGKAGVSALDRQGAWESARGDIGYVIDNSAPDFIMLPEIYTRLGDVQLLLKKPNEANIAFAKARELKPDYWPAYSHWAEFLINIGRRPEALKIVASGLAYSSDAKVLLEQFRLLGGKPSNIPKPAKKSEGITESTEDSTPSIPPDSIAPESERSEK